MTISPPQRRGLLLALFVIAAATLAYFSFESAYANPLCCADDSAMAVVAKNLAHGAGYSLSIEADGAPGLHPFSPTITTGPTVIVPAALAVAVLGDRPWVPGATAAALTMIFLLALVWFVSARGSENRGFIFGTVFIACAFIMTVRHREHWYSLLGEFPSALLALLGLAVLMLRPLSRKTALAGGLLLGLAVTTKSLAAFIPLVYLAVAAAAIALAYRRGQGLRRDQLRLMALTAAGTLAPVVAFELFKVLSLGPGGYAGNVAEQLQALQITTGAGTEPQGLGSMWSKAVERYALFSSHFGFSLLEVFVVVAAALALIVLQAQKPGVRRFAIVLTLLITVFLSWWVVQRLDRPRYALIALVLVAALVALMAYVRIGYAVAHVAVAVFLFTPQPGLVIAALNAAFAQGFAPNARTLHMEEAAEYLARQRGARLVSGYWFNVVDLEYLLPGADNFARWDHLGGSGSGDMLFVRNHTWDGLVPNRDLDRFEQHCRTVIWSEDPYSISRCSAATAR